MADLQTPWTDDLAALGEATRARLGSLDRTRSLLSTSSPQETKMRFFRAHPVLAALLMLVTIGIVSPVAYAVVSHLALSYDPDAPAPQIESDLAGQMQAAGVAGSVHAEGSGSDLAVTIGTRDPGVAISVNGEPTEQQDYAIKLAVKADLAPAQVAALEAVAQGQAMLDVMTHARASTPAAFAAAMTAVFAQAGYTVTVDVGLTGATVTVTGAP